MHVTATHNTRGAHARAAFKATATAIVRTKEPTHLTLVVNTPIVFLTLPLLLIFDALDLIATVTMPPTKQAPTRQAITLKGSTELVTEFFKYAVNT